MKQLVAVLILAIGLAGGALSGAGTATAHAARIASDPVENAELSQAPTRVSATFNEAMQPQFAAMTVVGPDGNVWSTGDLRGGRRGHHRRSAAAGAFGHVHGELPGHIGRWARRLGRVVVPADGGQHGYSGAVSRRGRRTDHAPPKTRSRCGRSTRARS